MSDTVSVKIQQERRVRKVPAIIIDRPDLQPRQVVFFLLLGTILGVLSGLAFWLVLASGPDQPQLPGQANGLIPPYVLPFGLVGVILGLAWGVVHGRTVTPRRDMVEVEIPSSRLRRRSSSTALERRR